jgi:phage tail-like protein
MPVREPLPLLGTSHFRVLIGRREFGFSEVGRLSSETDVTVPTEERSHRFETVVLRRALTRSTELFDWRMRIVHGKDDYRTVTIHQLAGVGGEIVNSWRLERAWPRRWSGPSFNAVGSDVAIEEIELVYDHVIWLRESDTATSNPSR